MIYKHRGPHISDTHQVFLQPIWKTFTVIKYAHCFIKFLTICVLYNVYTCNVTSYYNDLSLSMIHFGPVYTRNTLYCCQVFFCTGSLFVEIYLKASYSFILCSLFRSSGQTSNVSLWAYKKLILVFFPVWLIQIPESPCEEVLKVLFLI